jgi:D-alanyl-D-alanine endopeptidase (penicillin-binding protein 7)
VNIKQVLKPVSPSSALLFYSIAILGSAIFLNILPNTVHAAGDGDASYRKVPGDSSRYVAADLIKRVGNRRDLKLRSHIAMIYDERDDVVIYKKSANQKKPIASLTKLMTAIAILDADLDMDEVLTIKRADKDTIRYSKARLPFGTALSRRDMLMMALAASSNRAAFALARTFPGGTKGFVKAMNDKAKYLGLKRTRFADSAGLRNGNVSTANDVLKLVRVASQYSLIREYTTIKRDVVVDDVTGRAFRFSNTNRLVKKKSWDIKLSKTGFTSDAGNCLVMKLNIDNRPLVIVLLNSWGKLSKYGDTNRIKRWIKKAEVKARRLKLY